MASGALKRCLVFVVLFCFSKVVYTLFIFTKSKLRGRPGISVRISSLVYMVERLASTKSQYNLRGDRYSCRFALVMLVLLSE